MEQQSLVTIIPWNFIVTILNLFIQVYLMKRFLFKPIREVLDKRRALTEQALEDARTAKKEAEDARENYEAGIRNAKNEAQEIIEQARKDADQRAAQLLSEAQKAARSLKEKTDLDIEQAKKKAVEEAREEIGSLAVGIAEKVVEKEIDEREHEALIQDFLQRAEEAS